MFERILASIKEKLNNTKILDRYILKQVIEMFLMGVFVFTTIIFASDTFITLIKQIAKFGIPFKVAFIMILLNLPAVIVMTIPMGVLLATVMTLNRLSLSSEITVMRACGIGLNRIAKPIFIFAISLRHLSDVKSMVISSHSPAAMLEMLSALSPLTVVTIILAKHSAFPISRSSTFTLTLRNLYSERSKLSKGSAYTVFMLTASAALP